MTWAGAPLAHNVSTLSITTAMGLLVVGEVHPDGRVALHPIPNAEAWKIMVGRGQPQEILLAWIMVVASELAKARNDLDVLRTALAAQCGTEMRQQAEAFVTDCRVCCGKRWVSVFLQAGGSAQFPCPSCNARAPRGGP